MPRLAGMFGFIIAAMLVASTTSSAHAQGTFGALPDPISSRDLNTYAARLGLSEQQLLAIGEPHARYLEQFRLLREREIENFVDQFRGIRMRFDPTQLHRLEPLMRDFNRLMARIRTLDEQFFSEIQMALTDEQMEMLPRIRQHRERDRYTSEATRFVDFLNPAVRIDLSEMIAQLELPTDTLREIDPLLAQYEARLTANARRLFESAVKTVAEGVKQLDEVGFTEDMMNNPRQAMRMFEAVQQIWEEVTADLLKEAGQVTALSRGTFRQLGQMMPEDAWRLLREQYYGRAYPEAAAVGRSAEAHFVAALNMEHLPDDLVDRIAQMSHAHLLSQDRLAEQMIDLLEQRRRNLTLRQVVRMGEDQTQARIDELRERAEAADAGAIETLKATLGPELSGQLRPAPVATVRRDRIVAMRGPGDRGRPGARRIAAPGPRSGMGMGRGVTAFVTEIKPPDRVGRNDLRDYARRLQLSEVQQTVLESVHEDYLDRFESIRRDYALPYLGIVEQLRSADLPAAEAAERAESALDLLVAMLEAVRIADERFFADVRLAVVDAKDQHATAAVHGMQLSRERARYRLPDPPSAQPTPFGASPGEARVDLSHLVPTLSLAHDGSDELAAVLADYEVEATQLFRDRFQSEIAIQREMLRFAALGAAARSERDESRQRFRDQQGRMTDVRATARTINRSLAELNRRTLDDLLAVLPASTGTKLRDEYFRKAFPEAYDDPGSAELRIQAALAMGDLNDSQRSHILEIAADFRPLYAELTDRLLDHHLALAELQAAGPRPGGGGGGDWGARIERMNALELINFDRTELNESTLRRLRAVLRPDQLAQLPN